MVLQQLETLLSSRYDVRSFGEGTALVEALGAGGLPSLLVLDWEMPVLSGIEVCLFVRARHDETHLPIVILTAKYDSASASQALEAGANDFVRKPFEAIEFLARIETLLLVRRQIDERAHYLRALFQQVPAAVAHLRGPEHVCQMANPSYVRLVGNRPFLGKSFRQTFPEGSAPRVLDRLDEAYRTGEPFFANEMLVRLDVAGDGRLSDVYLNFTYQPTRDALGQVDGIFVHAVDVTETVVAKRAAQQAAEELARSERWLSTILSGIADAVIATDLRGRVTFANPVAETLTGWTQAEMTGRPLAHMFRAIDEETRQPVDRSLEQALDEGRVIDRTRHSILVRRDGSEIVIDDSVAPIRGARAEVTGAVLVFRDVHERRRVERERALRERELALAAAVGHALTRAAPMREQLQRCLEAVVDELEVAFARIWIVNEAAGMLELGASAGLYTRLDGKHALVPIGALTIGRIASTGQAHVSNDVAHDPEMGDPAWAIRTGMRAFAGFPLSIEGTVVGVLALFSREELPAATLRSLTGIADQIAVGIDRQHAEVDRERHYQEAETARRRAEEKRAELSALFSAAPVAITVLRGPDHVIELANPRVCEVWGRTEAQVVGKPLVEALPEVAGQGLEELLAGVLRTGIPYVGTEQLVRLARRQGGTLEDVYFTFVYQPMKDTLGNVEAVLVVASEVTESVQARRRIEELASVAREREKRLRLALEASRSGAWEVDLETQQIEADALVRDLFGLAPTELFTVKDALDRMPADDAGRVAERLATAVAPGGGGGYSAQFRVADRAGQLRWVDSRGQVTFGSDGRPSRFLGTLVDFTDRKNAESMREALLNSERSAREVSERQREFEQYLVGIVSHDLRSPLSAIAMGAEILRTAGITEERSQQAVGGIRRSVDRALHLIRDVLDFTQARLGGGLEFNPRTINLGEVARDAIDEIRLSAPARDVVLQVDEPAGVNGAGDPDRLFQVIFNLVSNALKYSAGGAPVTVLVRGGADAVEIAVHNFGPPIAAALVPQLFLPMRRTAGAGANVERSVGLGLYIVDHIVQLHGGRVDVSSTERDGTTFRVCLPRTSG